MTRREEMSTARAQSIAAAIKRMATPGSKELKRLLGKCADRQTTQVFHGQFPSTLRLDSPADSERADRLFHKVRTVSPKIVTAEMQATQQVLLSNIPVGALPVVIDLAASLRPVLGPS